MRIASLEGVGAAEEGYSRTGAGQGCENTGRRC
jgi:hypothetical protein